MMKGEWECEWELILLVKRKWNAFEWKLSKMLSSIFDKHFTRVFFFFLCSVLSWNGSIPWVFIYRHFCCFWNFFYWNAKRWTNAQRINNVWFFFSSLKYIYSKRKKKQTKKKKWNVNEKWSIFDDICFTLRIWFFFYWR